MNGRRAPRRAALVLSTLLLFECAAALAAPRRADADERATETILFIRHGEKSPEGFGQLSCKGLNRALALAGRLQARFGAIDAVFAPNPSPQKQDGALAYDYVRPLATVEPTAIRLGLPVHAALGYGDGDKLIAALQAPDYRNARVLVAWEHHAMQAIVPRLLAEFGGDAALVPKWHGDDFDSIWRVTVTRDAGGRASVAFAHEHQDLDGQSDVCPS